MPPTLHDRTRFFIDFPFDRYKRVKEERKKKLSSEFIIFKEYILDQFGRCI